MKYPSPSPQEGNLVSEDIINWHVAVIIFGRTAERGDCGGNIGNNRTFLKNC